MAPLTILRSVPLVIAAAFVLTGCSSTRIDPLEFDYYSNERDSATASVSPTGQPTRQPTRQPIGQPKAEPAPAHAEMAPIVPISGGAEEAGAVVSASSVTVRKGDSLYGLSVKHLGSGKRWPEIARLNGLSEADAKRLSVGRELKLPPR